MRRPWCSRTNRALFSRAPIEAPLVPTTPAKDTRTARASLTRVSTFPQTLDIVKKLNAQRVVMTHIEETDGLSHGDLAQLAGKLQGEGLNLAFAFDTQVVEV